MMFTKKAFRSALKANDQTKIWNLTAVKIGRKPERLDVFSLVQELATTKRDYKKAWALALRDNECRRSEQFDAIFINRGGFRQHDDLFYRGVALQMLRRLITEDSFSYTKVAFIGHTNLYFCSPEYGLSDYNKVRTCKIEGNEEFVKKVVELSHRIYKKKTFAGVKDLS